MPETATVKKDWQSSTVWGAIIMALSLIVEMIWGVEIDADTKTAAANNIASIISAVFALVGGVTTVVGRAKATGPTELSLFKILKYVPGVLGAVNKAKDAVTKSTAATVLLLALGALLALTAAPALAADGLFSTGVDLLTRASPSSAIGDGVALAGVSLMGQSVWPALINLGYCLIAAVVGIILFKVLDLSLILPGHRTMHLIAAGNVAAGNFAGLVIAGMFVMIGQVLG